MRKRLFGLVAAALLLLLVGCDSGITGPDGELRTDDESGGSPGDGSRIACARRGRDIDALPDAHLAKPPHQTGVERVVPNL